jgi:hypothetical protein
MSKPRKRDAQLAEDWQEIAETAAGRRIIADIMTWANIYSPIEDSDPINMARHVGEENVAKRIAYYLGYKPEQFPQMAEDDTDLLNRIFESQSRASH